MADYAMEKLNKLYSSYKKGDLFKKKIYEEESDDTPANYVSSYAESFKYSAETLVNRLDLVNEKSHV